MNTLYIDQGNRLYPGNQWNELIHETSTITGRPRALELGGRYIANIALQEGLPMYATAEAFIEASQPPLSLSEADHFRGLFTELMPLQRGLSVIDHRNQMREIVGRPA